MPQLAPSIAALLDNGGSLPSQIKTNFQLRITQHYPATRAASTTSNCSAPNIDNPNTSVLSEAFQFKFSCVAFK
ncbi:hypothetical protein KBA01_27400 [Kozakia baliensis]|nr:hypothetical protein KBA01_27400 [Kozakia baliensis]